MGLKKGQTNNPNGRKKGSVNKERKQIRDLITDEIAEKCIKSLCKLAEGVKVRGKDGKIYSQPPSIQATTYLLDQKFGRATQKTEVTGKDGEPMVLILPEKEAIRPPKNDDKKNNSSDNN